MIIINRDDIADLLDKRRENIKHKISLDLLEKFQLFLSGISFKKIELFGIGPVEFRGLAFMAGYGDLVNYAVQNNYRVFVYKEGGLFSKRDWYLEFIYK